MFGRTGRDRMSTHKLFLQYVRIRNTLAALSESVDQRDAIALTKRVDRCADATEGKTCCAGYELPGGKRFAQTGSDDADRNENDSGNDHRRRQKESD